MKCTNCGAEIGSNTVCEYCGKQISYEMRRENEQVNMQGCPKCGSSNIQFRRENQGEVRGKNAKKIIHKTVGFCKDCGHTWYPDVVDEKPKKRKTWLWVLGWICIFPVPLTILMLRKKDMKPALKYGIIAVAWLAYLLIGMGGNNSNTDTSSVDKEVVSSEEATTENISTTENKKIDTTEVKQDNTDTKSEEIVEETSEDDKMTMGQKNAVRAAKDYINVMPFSRNGLIKQLSSEYGNSFSEEDAIFAVDYLEQNNLVDWKEQAVKAAQNYNDLMGFSRDGLIQQLTSEYGDQYTQEEAEYAADQLGF